MKKITCYYKLLLMLLLSISGFSQEFIVTLANATMTTDQMEVDLMLTVPAPGVRLYSVSTGINFNAAILNGGTPSITQSTQGDASWVLLPGTIAPEIMANGGLTTPVTSFRGSQLPHLRVVQRSNLALYVDLLPGTYRVGRFRFTNTVPWDTNSDPELWLSPTAAIPTPGGTNTMVMSSSYGSSTWATAATTTTSPKYVTLGYTQGNPLRRSMFNSVQLGTMTNSAQNRIVTAVPNPFQEAFQLQLNTDATEIVEVTVYDMLGKQIENISAEADALRHLSIGQSYPSGFYNLKVSQGEKTQSVRMVKQ